MTAVIIAFNVITIINFAIMFVITNKTLKENKRLKNLATVNCYECKEPLTKEEVHYRYRRHSYIMCLKCLKKIDIYTYRDAPVIREQDELNKIDLNILKLNAKRHCGKSPKECNIEESDLNTCFKCPERKKNITKTYEKEIVK